MSTPIYDEAGRIATYEAAGRPRKSPVAATQPQGMTDNTALAQELEPCPFCGGDAHIGNIKYSRPLDDCRWAEDDAPVTEAFYGHCARCSAGHKNSFAGGHRTRERAIAAWNTRTPVGLPEYGDWLPDAWAQYMHELVGADAVNWALRLPATFRWADFHKHLLAKAALAAMPPKVEAPAADEVRELMRAMGAIHTEAKRANDVIRLNRDGGGQGRIKVATAMHRIERLSYPTADADDSDADNTPHAYDSAAPDTCRKCGNVEGHPVHWGMS